MVGHGSWPFVYNYNSIVDWACHLSWSGWSLSRHWRIMNQIPVPCTYVIACISFLSYPTSLGIRRTVCVGIKQPNNSDSTPTGTTMLQLRPLCMPYSKGKCFVSINRDSGIDVLLGLVELARRCRPGANFFLTL